MRMKICSKKVSILLYKDNGYKKDALLIPGWGLDYKIFEELPLKYNFIIPKNLNFEEEALLFIKKRVLVLGHSLGGFLGLNFAIKYPELIERLIIVGIRKKYGEKEIELMRKNLTKNKEATLYSFYKECFNESEFLKFKNLYLPHYLKMNKKALLEGLQLLSNMEIKSTSLKKMKNVYIVHGTNDMITPLDEAVSLCEKAKKGLVLINSGHIPFLNKNFLEWIANIVNRRDAKTHRKNCKL